MRRRLASLCVAGAATLLSLSAAASATALTTRVVPFRSVGGIAIGMTPAAVREHGGTPTFTQFNQGHLSQYGIRHDMTVDFWFHDGSRRVSSVETGGREYRTSAGIGVGSAVSALRRANPHLRCTSRACEATRDHVTTSFSLVHGRVALIEIVVAPGH